MSRKKDEPVLALIPDRVITYLRILAKKNLLLRKLVGYYLASSGLFDRFFVNYHVSAEWQKRIDDVLASGDNDFIPRVPDAGQIKGGKQIMHNGLKIHLGSYYGPEYSKMLILSKGVHEPQEERVFMEALKTLPQNAVMIEMGAFWSFYSMWFKLELRSATNFMIEPDEFNLGQGKRNFKLNGLDGVFVKAFVGKEPAQNAVGRTISVDAFVLEYEIEFVHMLHSDIQGFEYDMLLGARKTFAEDKVGYVFISTHSNKIHYDCLSFLREFNFTIIAAADIDESYSQDGLIVGRSPRFNGIGEITISKRVVEKSTDQ